MLNSIEHQSLPMTDYLCIFWSTVLIRVVSWLATMLRKESMIGAAGGGWQRLATPSKKIDGISAGTQTLCIESHNLVATNAKIHLVRT